MTHVTVDTSAIAHLAADLTAAPRRVQAQAVPIVSHGALNIKRQLTTEMRRSRHFRAVARAISYAIATTPTTVTATIGPRLSGEPDPPGTLTGSGYGTADTGGLAHIAYYGDSRRGGTVPPPTRAAAAEVPRLVAALTHLTREVI